MHWKRTDFIFSMLTIAIGITTAFASPPTSTAEAVGRIADRLVSKQLSSGVWPVQDAIGSGFFTGTMVAGLTDAYWMTRSEERRVG